MAWINSIPVLSPRSYYFVTRVGVLMDDSPAADEQSDRELATIQMQTVLELQAIQKTLVELWAY